MTSYNVGDKFRYAAPNGSVGEIIQINHDWPYKGGRAYYATYYYGLDVNGRPMTARSGLLKPSEIVPISNEEFLLIRNREGWGDTPDPAEPSSDLSNIPDTGAGRAFKKAMKGRCYSHSVLEKAWAWFQFGWNNSDDGVDDAKG